MSKELLLQVAPEIAGNDILLKQQIAKLERISFSEIQHVSILKRSIDARQKAIKINLKLIRKNLIIFAIYSHHKN